MGFRDIAKNAADAIKQELDRDVFPRPLTDAEKRAVQDRKKAAQAKKPKGARLETQGHYLGGSVEVPNVAPGKLCNLTLDQNGIHMLPLKPVFASQKPPLLSLPWSTVLNAEVTDAAEQRLKTQVRQRRYGGIFAPVFRTMPVAEQTTKKIARSHLEVRTQDGEFLFEVYGDAMKIKGQLLTAKPQWGDASPSPEG